MSSFKLIFDKFCKRDKAVISSINFAIVDTTTGAYQSGITFTAGDTKILRHTGAAWNVANSASAPVEISTTGVYTLALSGTEMTPDIDQYPITIKIDKTIVADTYRGSASIFVKPVEVNLKQIEGDLTNGFNATLKLKKLHINNSEEGDSCIDLYSAGDTINMYAEGDYKLLNAQSEGDGINMQSAGDLFIGQADKNIFKLYAAGNILEMYAEGKLVNGYSENIGVDIDSEADVINLDSNGNGHGIKITSKGTGKNAIDLHSDSDGKDLSAKEITAAALDTLFIRKLLSRNFKLNTPAPGNITFYDTDGTTPILVVNIVDTPGLEGRTFIA